jgi:hydroxyethylthiazole kinase-like sugar kinase family protein
MHYAENARFACLDQHWGAKGGEKRQSNKLVPRTKVAPSTKNCIVLVIGALDVLSSDASAESLLNAQTPEVQ